MRFEFKWVENVAEAGDASEFYLHGDAAPNERFNYVYSEWPELDLALYARKLPEIKKETGGR
ncbi:hypothetical protein [Paenibacillus sp. GCM10027626]|uniref:hypothetical protein n=1 Tax=Paenibacillus sp. GCM10027626 TaxID=3273411 RepID=UPI00363E6E6C